MAATTLTAHCAGLCYIVGLVAFEKLIMDGDPNNLSWPIVITHLQTQGQETSVYSSPVPGYGNLLEAQDGAEALAMCQRHQVDILFCDLRMPGIDGFEMIRRLRADPQLQDLDIVVVSGLTEDEIVENGGLPADVILYSKPVPFRELKGYVQAKIMALQRRGRST